MLTTYTKTLKNTEKHFFLDALTFGRLHIIDIQMSYLSSVHGNWTMWSPYSRCSKACGPGIRTKTRSCTNPRKAHGGNDCYGVKINQTDCNLQDCPRE